jgi:hypothetical protein
VQTAILKNNLYSVGQGALGMSVWNQVGGGPKKFGNCWSRQLLFCRCEASYMTRGRICHLCVFTLFTVLHVYILHGQSHVNRLSHGQTHMYTTFAILHVRIVLSIYVCTICNIYRPLSVLALYSRLCLILRSSRYSPARFSQVKVVATGVIVNLGVLSML